MLRIKPPIPDQLSPAGRNVTCAVLRKKTHLCPCLQGRAPDRTCDGCPAWRLRVVHFISAKLDRTYADMAGRQHRHAPSKHSRPTNLQGGFLAVLAQNDRHGGRWDGAKLRCDEGDVVGRHGVVHEVEQACTGAETVETAGYNPTHRTVATPSSVDCRVRALTSVWHLMNRVQLTRWHDLTHPRA